MVVSSEHVVRHLRVLYSLRVRCMFIENIASIANPKKIQRNKNKTKPTVYCE